MHAKSESEHRSTTRQADEWVHLLIAFQAQTPKLLGTWKGFLSHIGDPYLGVSEELACTFFLDASLPSALLTHCYKSLALEVFAIGDHAKTDVESLVRRNEQPRDCFVNIESSDQPLVHI